ncbi:hypothetical protein [Haloferula sp. A504]|uniref:hypothetical protein n=1 Tax=Haloferula sp. A504 TaxID=3373601 RepID=UPI0031C09B0B|nr:hypothetical protein [Verrucomicrobiaceae bacterium E54]
MNLTKLANKTRDFLSFAERKRKEKKKFLKHVLKKLKKHEKSLLKELKETSDADRRAGLESEIALVHAQRKKGVARLQELKKPSKSAKKA